MSLKAYWQAYTLNFKQPSRTSREVLTTKVTYYIKICDEATPWVAGYGEAAYFPGLSAESSEEFMQGLTTGCAQISQISDINKIAHISPSNSRAKFQRSITEVTGNISSSAVRAGLETALSDLANGGQMRPFNSEPAFQPIAINGLIWMGTKEFMLAEIEKKLNAGFSCLKLKIGGIDFESEIDILRTIRDRFSPSTLTIRLDANGAFTSDLALNRLDRLSHYHIHSIEQPIKAGQLDAMHDICAKTPIPIALDEEIIGITPDKDKRRLLKHINPQYVILKPSLCGGFIEAARWIDTAKELGIGWWATSALESDVGLNAIARWCSTLNPSMHQGLGTGLLYTNNIPSPLHISGEFLATNTEACWGDKLHSLFS